MRAHEPAHPLEIALALMASILGWTIALLDENDLGELLASRGRFPRNNEIVRVRRQLLMPPVRVRVIRVIRVRQWQFSSLAKRPEIVMPEVVIPSVSEGSCVRYSWPATSTGQQIPR